MLKRLFSFIVFILCMPFCSYAQRATISGLIRDEQSKGMPGVTIAVVGTADGTATNDKGYYILDVPAEKNIVVIFSALGYEKQRRILLLRSGQNYTQDILMKASLMDTVVITERRKRYEDAAIEIKSGELYKLPGENSIEKALKTFTGSNNELTNQYSVRGGNYDENLVYVDGFEIYRPFLVRAGQQEGLSFVNPDLASSVNFSVGGFQAIYGDKLSSVLDVKYKTPDHFAGSVMASLLGFSLHLEGASKNKKLTYLIGAREKSNQYLLQSQPTKGVYNPSFTDVQGVLNYKFNDRWQMELIANYARNRFTFYPQTETTTFGLVNQAYQLDVYYNGGEIDQFDSRFAGFSTTYTSRDKHSKIKLLLSGFQTNEQETYDISGEYLLGLLQTDLGKKNFGQVQAALGTGLVHDYTRDFLKANVGNAALHGTYEGNKHFLQYGVDVNYVSINDNLHEWERRDSAGFSQPYDPYNLNMSTYYNAIANLNYIRISGYIQDNIRFSDSVKFTGSIGARFNYNFLNKEFVVSPRIQLGYKPEWKKDVVFRFAAGIYAQPTFYREMRDFNGNLNTNVNAQKSYHIVLGSDYNLKVNNRPFKITTELYYKGLWDLIPYQYDNIQVRYYGRNDAVGYVYGGEMRIYGDLIKGATSWLSIGLMKAAYDIKDDKIVQKSVAGVDSNTIYPGYIPLPNDQRFNIGLYIEDYLPHNKNFKVHLSAILSGGLPFGPPNAPLYADTLRMPSYKRVDVGFSALLLDGAKKNRPVHSFFRNINSIWASLEVFNLLGIQNTLSYTWIQDQTSGRTFAVPNHLTSRLLNIKLLFRF